MTKTTADEETQPSRPEVDAAEDLSERPEPPRADNVDKVAPSAVTKNETRQAEQDAANEDGEFKTVLPDPPKPIKSDKQAVDKVLEYLGSYGTLNFELKYIRDILLEGRTK